MFLFYRKRFPYYNIEGDPIRNTVVFRNGNETFAIEELIAQILQKGKQFAQDFIGQPITECVIVVPGFFGQAERLAILSAAKLINLKVLQLQNDYTAVALNYGIFRRKEINETAQYFVFYDMGALKTSASVISYQLIKDKGTRETNPVASVIGVAFDRNLGGLEMQLRLRDHLANEFNAMKKTKTDVKTNPRAMAKLFKEAGRVKNILSANSEHYAQIEGLIEEIDFRVLVTREQFEKMCMDLFERAPLVLEKALKAAGLPLDVINQVIIVGGGTRVPKVQEFLKKTINQELGKNLNADEAATMGAVYRAADLATGFKVKKFLTKDAILYPLQVVFEREGESGATRQVKRTLFGQMNAYPQKKVITFNKNIEDFSFEVNYADLDHLTDEDVKALGNLTLTRVSLKNIAKAMEVAKGDNIESKGIKAHFVMDESGLLSLTNVELVYEKTVLDKETDENDESPLFKLSNTISNLFSSGKTDEDDKKTDEPIEQHQSVNETDNKTNTTDIPINNNNNTQPESDSIKNKTEKPKIITLKEPIESNVVVLHTLTLDGDDFKTSKDKVKLYEDKEKERVRRETALNKLESYVIETQDRLNQEEYESCATKTEKEQILKSCSEVSDWLYEDGADAEAIVYETKLDKLLALTNPVYSRHWEHNERPEALKALKSMIEEAEKFAKSAANLTKANPEKDVFTDVEIQTLEKVIKETRTWRESEILEQNKLPRHVEVRLTVKAITDKMSLLDREVKYLVNKLKIWKPKVIPTKEPTVNETVKPTEENIEKPDESKIETQEEIPSIEDEIKPTETDQPQEEQHTEL